MYGYRHWMRHMAMMPEGFLRYQALRLLSEKPLSGYEIMTEIERQTDGYWRPSPSSIYPLLSWLQERGHIKEAEGEAGIKRYTLTEQGKSFLEEHIKTQEELQEHFRDFGPGLCFMGPPWFEFYPERGIGTAKSHKGSRARCMLECI